MQNRKKRRNNKKGKLLLGAAFVLALVVVSTVVCIVAFSKKGNVWKTPEELLIEYMNHIQKQEYEEMYTMLNLSASGNISQEDFVKRNSAIYEGIEVQNMIIEIIAYDEEEKTVKYEENNSRSLCFGTFLFKPRISLDNNVATS